MCLYDSYEFGLGGSVGCRILGKSVLYDMGRGENKLGKGMAIRADQSKAEVFEYFLEIFSKIGP